MGIDADPRVAPRPAQRPALPVTAREPWLVNTAWQLIAARVALGWALFSSGVVVLSRLAGAGSGVATALDGLPPVSLCAALGLGLVAGAGLATTSIAPRRHARRGAVVGLSLSVLAVEFGVWRIDHLVAGGRPAVAPEYGLGAAVAVALGLLVAGLLAAQARWARAAVSLWAAAGLMAVSSTALFLLQAAGGPAASSGLPALPVGTAPCLALVVLGLLLSASAQRATARVEAAAALAAELRGARPMIAQIVGTLLAGLVVTTLVVLNAQRTLRTAESERFVGLTERLSGVAQRRAGRIADALKGVRGLYAASDTVTRQEFAAYVASRELGVEYQGVLGIGFLERVEPSSAAPTWSTDAVVASDGQALYVAKHLFPPTVLSPAAWGLEVGSAAARRAAIEKAVQTGLPAISERLTLMADGAPKAAVLYLLPVYRSGAAIGTKEERQEALVGIICGPTLLDGVLSAAADTFDGGLEFAIYDGESTATEALLFEHREVSHGGLEDPRITAPRLERLTPLRVAGRTWTLLTRATARLDAGIDRTAPAKLGIGGSVLSVLLAGIVWSLRMGRTRALALAEGMTSALRESEEAARRAATQADRLAEIARRTSNAVIITDAEGAIEWVNEGFTRLSGYTLEDVVGKRPGAFLVGPESDPAESRRMGEAVRRGRSVNAEIFNYDKSGRSYAVAIEISPLRDGDVVTGFMAIESDISDQRRATAELREAQAKAEGASRAKSEFLANMSHEIRTPLTAILGFAELLREEGSDVAQRQRHIDTIKGAGRHLLTIINDILDLSKIEADKMTVERVDTQLVGALREVDSLMRPQTTTKGLTLEVVLATPLPDRVLSDPTRLRQILMNLAGNAVKFTPSGTVSLIASYDAAGGQPRLRVDVVDTGLGMTAEQAGRLFQPFGQADATMTRKHGGTGLGLTISRRLSALMGGTVTLVDTAPGKGSRFRLELPAEPAPGALPVARLDVLTEPPVPRPASVTRLKGRVLLAEDGLDNQQLIAFHLRKAGATVDVADNGAIALRLIDAAEAEGAPYDLLVTDMQMPEMDGYTLASTLRGRRSMLPIVALTAHAMAEDRARCLAAGCDDYAVKPIERATLLATCAAWMTKVEAPTSEAA